LPDTPSSLRARRRSRRIVVGARRGRPGRRRAGLREADVATAKSRVVFVAACAAAVALLGATTPAQRAAASPPPAGPPAVEDYDSFCRRTPDEKKTVFDAITAENRAELVRAQIERWRDANLKRLTPPQLSSLKDMLELMTADLYRPETRTDAAVARMRELEQKQISLFTREDLIDMQLTGPCIAKKGAARPLSWLGADARRIG
jgi:hypothetical protein